MVGILDLPEPILNVRFLANCCANEKLKVKINNPYKIIFFIFYLF